MPTQIHVCGMNMPSVWCFPKGPEFSSRPTWLMGLQTDGASLLYDFLSVFYTDSLSKGSADDFPEPVAAKRFFELQASDKDVRLQREHSVQIRGGELQFPKPSLWHWPSKSVDVVVAYVDTSRRKR